jgi:LysR family glycine cleavage system transcriptional activator
MIKKNINLNWLRSFEAVARHLSFTMASKELGLTQTAVSLQIKSLESKLGQKLFIRHAKSLTLTEIAKAYLPTVRDALLTLNLSTNGLFGPDVKSTIVVRTSMALIVWLSPRIAEFQALYPNVGIKFVTAIWIDSTDTQPVDIDIVLVPDGHASAHMEKLSCEYLIPIVSTNMAEQIESVEDLTAMSPIHILGFDDHWSRYLNAFNLQHDVRSTRLQVDTFIAACEFVACDLGCAVVLERFAQNAIEMGRAVKYAGERVALSQSHYLVENKTSAQMDSTVEAFKEWLRTLF